MINFPYFLSSCMWTVEFLTFSIHGSFVHAEKYISLIFPVFVTVSTNMKS